MFRRIRERGVLVAFATARDFRFVTEHITPLFGVINAINEVKAVTRYICGDCDDDGVAKWLGENVL